MIKTSHGPVQLWCDNSLDPGGWTVIQKRTDGSVNFFTNWDNYKVIIKKYPEGNLQCTVTINFPHSVTFSICWITTFLSMTTICEKIYEDLFKGMPT